MKDEKKREALKKYEDTIRNACDVRRAAIDKVESDFKITKDNAERVYRKAIGEM